MKHLRNALPFEQKGNTESLWDTLMALKGADGYTLDEVSAGLIEFGFDLGQDSGIKMVGSRYIEDTSTLEVVARLQGRMDVAAAAGLVCLRNCALDAGIPKTQLVGMSMMQIFLGPDQPTDYHELRNNGHNDVFDSGAYVFNQLNQEADIQSGGYTW